MKWISIKEKLPKSGEEVIITDGYQIKRAQLSKGDRYCTRDGTKYPNWVYCSCCGPDKTEVTHWSNFPDFPVERDQQNEESK